jgi:hypothetical protein
MVIRSQQMGKITERRIEDFRAFLAMFLSQEFPDQCALLDKPELLCNIERHTTRARGHAIEDENSLTKYVYLKWLLGENFETLPDPSWLIALLEDRARPARERMDMAVEGVEYQLERVVSYPKE